MSLYFSVLRPRSNFNDSAADAESFGICTSSLSCCWSDRDGDDEEAEEEEEEDVEAVDQQVECMDEAAD